MEQRRQRLTQPGGRKREIFSLEASTKKIERVVDNFGSSHHG